MQKSIYVNTHAVKATAEWLREYRNDHGQSKTPMADAFMAEAQMQEERGVKVNFTELTTRYYRAAKRLGWKVTRSKGILYENGVAVWNTNGRCEKAAKS